jgi:hypothetical protein
VPVANRRATRDFLDVPRIANRLDPNWVRALPFVERQRLDARRHPFYGHGHGAFWVAYRGGAPVGRIGALVNKAHLARHRDGAAHFAMLEAVDDPAVFHALLQAAESWALREGLTKIAGPYNLSANEELGLLVDGFDRPSMVLMGHAQAYCSARLAAEGYTKAKDLHAFLCPLGVARPRLQRLTDRAQTAARAAGVRLRSATRRTFVDDVRRGVALYNAAWAGNWGFVPMQPREVDLFIIRDLRAILRPQHTVLAERDGELLGFIAAVPNINEALAGPATRFLPLGLARLAWKLSFGKFASARLFLLGVEPGLQGQALSGAVTLALVAKLMEVAQSYGIREVECSWVLEDNSAMIKFCDLAGLRRYKTYRIYEKKLPSIGAATSETTPK